MQKPALLVLLSLLLLTVCGVLVLNSCGAKGDPVTAPPPPPPPPPAQIRHIVIIFQENRTPDNLFQDPVLIGRGADIVQSGLNSLGQTIPLAPIPLASSYDLAHDHRSFYQMYDGGKMDGANKVAVACNSKVTTFPPNAPYT